MERIGIIGLGRMGAALAARLAAEGATVTGWTRSGLSPDRAASLGIARAESLTDLAGASDILLLSLFDDAAVAEVVDTLLTRDLSGKLLADTSTVSPQVLQSRAAALQAAGCACLDAPISGGPELVLSGQCGVFLGGADADAARLRPVAERFAARVLHVGPLGAGMAMKVINNGMMQGYWVTLGEMAALAKRAGLNLETAMGILAGGPAAMPMFRDRLPRILGEDTSVGFPVAGVAKDAGVFRRVAEDAGVPSRIMELSEEMMTGPLADGVMDRDVAILIKAAYDAA